MTGEGSPEPPEVFPAAGPAPLDHAPAAPPPEDESGEPWRRLSPRSVLAAPLGVLANLLPALIALVLLGGRDSWQLWGSGLTLAAVAAHTVSLCLTTRYRVGEDHVELRTGWLLRRHRAVPLDRVRTVDLTANPVHRLLRLTVVRIGTGRQDHGAEDELTLDAVPRAEAQRLREVVLSRATLASSAGTATAGDADEARADAAEPTVLAEMQPRWLRYAPLTLSGMLAVSALVGGAIQLLQELDIRPEHVMPLLRSLLDLRELPVLTVVGVAAGAVLVISTLASLVVYLLSYWNYRLTREPDGTLRVRRGLLTTRSVSLEERRLRGVELTEALLLRAGRGARCDAVTTGLGTGEGSGLLLPPAPRAEAHRVAAEVLRTAESPTRVALRRHPRAALVRRLVRTVVPTLLLAGVLLVLSWAGWAPFWSWPTALALLPVAVLLGWDRYRSLGHALTERHLVRRSGSVRRSTVALERDGIIGWRITQSLFQRRVGLATVGVVTAAGIGVHTVVDVDFADGLALAEAAVPDLLTPFLDHDDHRSATGTDAG
ncbi:MAG TPA: PH domain-containing protein [Pseudonocardiaceae bacterium]